MVKEFLRKNCALIVAFTLLFLAINYAYLRYKHHDAGVMEATGKDYKVPEKTYTPPIIKLPFTKDKQPIPNERLPIPKKQIAKTIEITTEPGAPNKIDIIIDKKGQIYLPKDIPQTVHVVATAWKPKFIDFSIAPSAGLMADSQNLYASFSLTVIRIGRLNLGGTAGIPIYTKATGLRFLLGPSLSYPIMETSIDSNIKINIVTGYNLVNKSIFGGVGIQW